MTEDYKEFFQQRVNTGKHVDSCWDPNFDWVILEELYQAFKSRMENEGKEPGSSTIFGLRDNLAIIADLKAEVKRLTKLNKEKNEYIDRMEGKIKLKRILDDDIDQQRCEEIVSAIEEWLLEYLQEYHLTTTH